MARPTRPKKKSASEMNKSADAMKTEKTTAE
jgi:hypothetical protein